MNSDALGHFPSHQDWQILQMSTFFLTTIIIHKQLRKVGQLSRKGYSEVEVKHGIIIFVGKF